MSHGGKASSNGSRSTRGRLGWRRFGRIDRETSTESFVKSSSGGELCSADVHPGSGDLVAHHARWYARYGRLGWARLQEDRAVRTVGRGYSEAASRTSCGRGYSESASRTSCGRGYSESASRTSCGRGYSESASRTSCGRGYSESASRTSCG